MWGDMEYRGTLSTLHSGLLEAYNHSKNMFINNRKKPRAYMTCVERVVRGWRVAVFPRQERREGYSTRNLLMIQLTREVR